MMIPESLRDGGLAPALVRLGLSQSYVSQLVNRRRSPSLRLALRIERALGVPPGFWVDHDAPSFEGAATLNEPGLSGAGKNGDGFPPAEASS